MKKVDWIGKRFGVLTVIGYGNTHTCPNGHKHKTAKCLCDVCGEVHTKLVNALHDKCICPNTAHRKSHGKSNTPLYNVWYGIKQRCYYHKHNGYKYYGQRGIKMCDEWLNDFQTFYDWSLSNGYKKGLQIDRVDVNGNYEPDNCRWVSSYVNSNNKRTNILFTHDGKTMSLKQWCNYFNISYKTCMTRYYRGHSIEECLNLTALNDKREGAIPHNAKLYSYNGNVYTIRKLAEVLGVKRWKMYDDLNKGRLPKGVTKYNG